MNDRKFKEFVWRGNERIHRKEEIYSDAEKKIKPKEIKGMKTPEEIDEDEMILANPSLKKELKTAKEKNKAKQKTSKR